MDMQWMNEEQVADLIRQGLNLESANQTQTNNNVEAPQQPATNPEWEAEDETEETKDENKEAQRVKILESQASMWKKEAQAKAKEIEAMKSKLTWEWKELNEDMIRAIVSEMLAWNNAQSAMTNEKSQFLSSHPEATSAIPEIEQIMDKHNMNYDWAYLLYNAMNNPSALLSEQDKRKVKGSNWYWVWGWASTTKDSWDYSNMSSAEMKKQLEEMHKRGEIRL